MRADVQPPIDLEDLQHRARAAYERGRTRHAVLGAWPVVALFGIALLLGGRPWAVTAIAIALFAAVVVFLRRGGVAARAVMPGLLGGSLPMLAGLLSCRVPHGCSGAACTDRCLLVCFCAAALGGAFVARSCRAIAPGRRDVLAVGGLVAAVTGGLGCVLVGAAGLAGLALGLGAVALPTMIRAPR